MNFKLALLFESATEPAGQIHWFLFAKWNNLRIKEAV